MNLPPCLLMELRKKYITTRTARVTKILCRPDIWKLQIYVKFNFTENKESIEQIIVLQFSMHRYICTFVGEKRLRWA